MSCPCDCCCCPCIYEAQAGIVESCKFIYAIEPSTFVFMIIKSNININKIQLGGKFKYILTPGCHCVAWPFYTLQAKMSLRIEHFEMNCDTKTRDNVFVQVVIAVQYRVIQEKVSSAYYRLADPQAQIKSYVYDVVRSTIPTLNVDDAFASKDHLAHDVQDRLSQVMNEYGYEIIAALVVDINPDRMVKAAMNEINGTC